MNPFFLVNFRVITRTHDTYWCINYTHLFCMHVYLCLIMDFKFNILFIN